MLLKQIDYFLAVVNAKSFTAAARECGVSQSAISQQIGLLEKNLGVRLLERHNRTFTLTEAGEYFYKESTKISRSVAKMMKETERIGKNEDQRR